MDVIKNVRKNNLKSAILGTLFATIPNGILIMFFYGMITDGFDGEMFFIMLIVGLFTIPMDIGLYRTWKVAINPNSSDIFKKYGSPDKLNKILKEIEQTIEYEDKYLIISKNYISDKKDYEKIMACDDILGVHKLVHKTNFVVDYYQIVITDKYGQEASYTYKVKEEEKVNQLLMIIGKKCKNAELGYTQREQEHIKNNKVELPSNEILEEDSPEDDEYECPDCGNIIYYGDKFCKECGCKMNWEDDTEEQNTEAKTFAIEDMASGMFEYALKQVDDMHPMFKVNNIKFSFENYTVATFAYLFGIFVAHASEKLTKSQYNKLDKYFIDKFIEINNDACKDNEKKREKQEKFFIKHYTKAKEEAESSMQDDGTFIDKGISDMYLLSFLSNEEADKVKIMVVTHILGKWVMPSSEILKQINVEK